MVGWMLKPAAKTAGSSIQENAGADLTPEAIKQKQENLEEIRSHIKDKERITNDEIQNLLNVSDATTERYLDVLEREGLVRQIGKTGQSVYYEVL